MTDDWLPLKHVVRLNPETLGEDTHPATEFRYIDISATGRGKLASDPVPMTFESAPSRARRVLREGDTILSTVRTYLRAVWTLREPHTDLIASTGFVCLRPKPELDSRYLGWLAQSDLVVDEVGARSVGVSYPAISPFDVGQIKAPVPPLDDQRAIADYLDRETARIDALTLAKRSMSALIEEKAERAFEDATSAYGLLFPSTLELPLGEWRLPKGWRAPNLSQVLLQLTNGYVGPTRDILVDDGVRYIQSLHIKGGKIDFARGPYFVTPKWHDARPRIHLRQGDVLIVQTGDIGQVAVVPPGFGEASCHALLIARANQSLVSGEYLGAFLRSPFGRASLLSRATGALHPHLEAGIKNVPVVVPPAELQQDIVDRVASGEQEATQVMRILTHQIQLLQTRRQALITAAVTGEIEVAVAA
jgi:type I restriction enzyme, S subunit